MEPLKDLGGALLDLGAAASRLVNVCIGQRPPSDSLAGRHLAAAPDGPDWETNSVRRAHEGLLAVDLAAIDHVRALAATPRSPVLTTVATATVARGAVEAFSRMHWLLAADTAQVLVHRHVSLALSDVTYAGRLQPDVPLRTGSGGSITVAEYQAVLRDRLARYTSRMPERVSPTDLATEVLNATVGDGRVKYSQLSTVAHGEGPGVNAFIDLDSTHTNPKRELMMHLPLSFAIEYTGYAMVLCAHEHDALVNLFQPPAAEQQRWVTRRDRAGARFVALDRAYRAAA